MDTSRPHIDPRLATAFALFLQELDKHQAFFDEVVTQLYALAKTEKLEEPLTEERTKLLIHRFHIIRGGAGFLGLRDLKAACEEAEKRLAIDASHTTALEAINKVSEQFDLISKNNNSGVR